VRLRSSIFFGADLGVEIRLVVSLVRNEAPGRLESLGRSSEVPEWSTNTDQVLES
jgi:hypothetical protein